MSLSIRRWLELSLVKGNDFLSSNMNKYVSKKGNIFFCKLDCEISNFCIFQITTEKNPGMQRKNLHFINTTVSSKMLSSIAKIEGLTYTETLTGFKWMANKAVEIQSNAEEQVCRYLLHI